MSESMWFTVRRTNDDPRDDTWEWTFDVAGSPVAVSCDSYPTAHDAARAALSLPEPRSTPGPSTGTPEPSQAASEAHSDEQMLTHYSRALDEIYRLRAILAYEAQVTDAHHEGYKTFPKSRKRFVVEQAERMRAAARGEGDYPPRAQQVLREAGASGLLTRSQWESR